MSFLGHNPSARLSPLFGAPKAIQAGDDALHRRISELEAEVARLGADAAGGATVELDDERILQEVGISRYHHPLENAAEYKTQLNDLSQQIKTMVGAGDAVLASDMFTFNNSLAKGREMTAELSKLMLRAYNADADNCVRALRPGRPRRQESPRVVGHRNRQTRRDDGDADQPELPPATAPRA